MVSCLKGISRTLIGLAFALAFLPIPSNSTPCSSLFADLSKKLSALLDQPAPGTALAVQVEHDGRTLFYYRSEKEAQDAAARMKFSGIPVIQKTSKSAIQGQDQMSISWMGPSDYDRPYDLSAQTYILNLSENLWIRDPNNPLRTEAFNNGETIGKVIDELNKVVDRAEFDALADWVYALDVTREVNPKLVQWVGKGGKGNCFGTTLCVADIGSEFLVWTPEFEKNLLAHFTQVRGPIKKGDVGVLYDKGEPIHAFTVIQPGPEANPHDGWVFTRNGQGWTRPMHYQRQRDSMAAYPESTSIRYFRKIGF